MIEEEINAIIARHANSARHATIQNPVSRKYPSLTELGVTQAQGIARTQLASRLKTAPQGTVLYIGGKTDSERTGATTCVYGEELWAVAKTEPGLYVLTRDQVGEMSDVKEGIERTLVDHPHDTVVITNPQIIDEMCLGYNNRWTGEGEEYFYALMAAHKDAPALRWVEGVILQREDGSIIKAPDPIQSAKAYLQGISRLHATARTYVLERPLVVLGVGHQLDMDVTATYAATGIITSKTMREVTDGKIVGESELISLGMQPSGAIMVNYRGKIFTHQHGTE